MKKHFLSILAVGALLAGGLASCGPKDSKIPGSTPVAPSSPVTPPASSEAPAPESTYGDGPIKLKLWGSSDDFQVFSKMVTSYNAKAAAAEKLTLTVVGIGENDIGTRFGSDPTKGPDLFHIPGNNLESFNRQGFLTSLNGDLAGANISISESALKTGTIGENLIALPFTINTYFAYYNTSKVTANDIKSWSALETKATASSKKIMGVNIGDGFYSQSVIRSLGIQIYGDNNSANDSTGIVKTDPNVVKFAKLVNKIQTTPSQYAVTYNTFQSGVKSGDILMAVDGTWNYSNYVNDLGDDFGMAILPKIDIDGFNNDWGSPIDNKFISVNSSLKGDKLIAAKKFAYYMASDEGQRVRFETRQTLPTSANLLESADFQAQFKGAQALSDYYASTANFANPTASLFNTTFWAAARAFATDLNVVWTDAIGNAAIDKFGQALLTSL